MMEPHAFRRSGAPWLFVELIAIVSWLRDGDPMQQIARRLQRRIPEVRAVIWGEGA